MLQGKVRILNRKNRKVRIVNAEEALSITLLPKYIALLDNEEVNRKTLYNNILLYNQLKALNCGF